MSETPENKALNDIFQWSKDKPSWIREALARLYSKEKLDENDFDELYNICINDGTIIDNYSNDSINHTSQSGKVIRLLEVKDVNNINALAEEQRLTFSPSDMTIVYGDNGSGKSGYVRILKKVCRARYTDAVLTNVYKQDVANEQSATIKFSIDGTRSEFTWKNSTIPPNQLSAISVFDAKCASIHVDAANNVAYSPFPMQLLEKLAESVQSINGKIERSIKILQDKTPSFLKNTSTYEGTFVGEILGKIQKNQ